MKCNLFLDISKMFLIIKISPISENCSKVITHIQFSKGILNYSNLSVNPDFNNNFSPLTFLNIKSTDEKVIVRIYMFQTIIYWRNACTFQHIRYI